eukprot:scaffold131934_cov29-Tisochrysis_lutea.AAC.2
MSQACRCASVGSGAASQPPPSPHLADGADVLVDGAGSTLGAARGRWAIPTFRRSAGIRGEPGRLANCAASFSCSRRCRMGKLRIIIARISTCPISIASSTAETPCAFVTSGEAPTFSNRRVASWAPTKAHRWSGVLPL